MGVKDWSGDNSGYDCEVVKRHDTNASYLVSLVTTANRSKRVSNVPREAIKFADKPYTTDLHMIGAFRQPIGIPDDIMPDAWKNKVIDGQSRQTCNFEDETCESKDEDLKQDDPCALPDF